MDISPDNYFSRNPEMLSPIGGFGGLFQIDLSKYKEPVMVSSIDGVGTKLMVAMMMEKYDTVGCDIVNHCINDISVQGAEPVYFLDYIGIGKLRSPLYEQVLSGIAKACREANCAVLGGETAEMPGFYPEDEYDLAGFACGIADRDRIIDKEKITAGDVIIALPSSGVHSNGFSLVRKVFDVENADLTAPCEALGGKSIGKELRDHGQTGLGDASALSQWRRGAAVPCLAP